MAPRVTVVIPSWNGRELLDVVLPTLAGQTYSDFTTLVVDNGSSDDSIAYLRSSWPDVEVLALPENIGFAPAVNRAIEACDSELVALVNNDMELDPDWLGELVAALDVDPRAGSVCSKLIDFHNRSVVDGAGDLLAWSGGPDRRGHGELDRGQYDDADEVFSPCAAAALFRRAAFHDVGLFDEDFFAYLEDVDWGFRARLRGWTCRYVPTSVAFHMGGATTKRHTDLEAYLCRRNQIALVVKDFPAASLRRYGWFVLTDLIYGTVAGTRRGTVRAQLTGTRHALRRLPKTLRARRDVQRRRTAGHAELRPVVMSPVGMLRARCRFLRLR